MIFGVAVAVGVVVVLAVIIWLWQRSIQPQADSLSAYFRLQRYCTDLYIELDMTDMYGDVEDMVDACSEWAGIYMDDKRVHACDRLSPDLDAPFRRCLIDEDILPIGVVRNR